jgi:hypothetical protein
MFDKDVSLRRLEKRLEKLSDEATKIIWWQVVTSFVLFIPTFGAVFFEKPYDDSALTTTPVPDDWLGDVARLKTVSADGSNFITSALDEKDWLSIAEAKRFLEIEKAEKKAESERSTKGLAALKTRLNAKAAA